MKGHMQIDPTVTSQCKNCITVLLILPLHCFFRKIRGILRKYQTDTGWLDIVVNYQALDLANRQYSRLSMVKLKANCSASTLPCLLEQVMRFSPFRCTFLTVAK